MPQEKPQRIRLVLIVLLAVLITSALALGTSEGQMRLRLFVLGTKHGYEDRQSGITYAADASGWEIIRNGASWTPSDRELVQKLFASSPEDENHYSSVFMVGYRCDYLAPNYWLAGIAIVLLIIIIGRLLRRVA